MDIPEAVRAAKRTRAARDFPEMARFPHVLDQFVDAALEEEWDAKPLFHEVRAEQEDGLAVLKFMRSKDGNPVTVKATFPEALELHRKIGELLFGI